MHITITIINIIIIIVLWHRATATILSTKCYSIWKLILAIILYMQWKWNKIIFQMTNHTNSLILFRCDCHHNNHFVIMAGDSFKWCTVTLHRAPHNSMYEFIIMNFIRLSAFIPHLAMSMHDHPECISPFPCINATNRRFQSCPNWFFVSFSSQRNSILCTLIPAN